MVNKRGGECELSAESWELLERSEGKGSVLF